MVERAILFRNGRTKGAFILCLLAAGVTGGGACSNESDGPVTNTVSFRLDFGGGVMLSSVDYVMTGPNNFSRTGFLSVGNQPNVAATFQNLPAGRGYNIQVTGTANNGEDHCEGQLTFAVNPSMMVTLTVPLTCTGRVGITATVGNNICPTIDNLSAVPAEVNVGQSIQLTAAAHDPDNGPNPLTARWVTTGGMLSGLSTSGATFTCTAPGVYTVELRVSDDTTNPCPASATLTLACTTGPV